MALEELELTVEDLSVQLNETVSATSKLIDGELSITHELAERLSQTLGSSADFWIAREEGYRSVVKPAGQANEDKNQNPTASDLITNLPIADMKKLGWIKGSKDETELFYQCLEFLGISALTQWPRKYAKISEAAAFRKSQTFSSCNFSIAAWLRQGEVQSSHKSIAVWSSKQLSETLPQIRRLTWVKKPDIFLPKLEKYLSQAGVAFEVVKAPKGCPCSGASRKLKNGSPHIQVSFRYLSDDHFWFTIFHEIAHLLLHEDKLPFYEVKDMELSEYENEANNFASQLIVPARHYEEFFTLTASKNRIINFAKKIETAPGLVVGQMQHNRLISYKQMNFLKRRFKWS